ncbi:MAG TPA: PIN domain-containing protein [Phycisphaerae bacterium]|nr:PIN domain-containing protein [Phycisphaerae bacterium]
MTPCFGDTFYFIALLNSADEAHERALNHARIPRPLITTTWVLTEFADGFANAPSRVNVAEFIRRLRANPNVIIIPASDGDFDRALQLYDQRPDKEWSLTDCTSFIVMQDHQLTEALTGDHHFEQAGFVPLLK